MITDETAFPKSPIPIYYEEEGHFSADNTPTKTFSQLQQSNEGLLRVKKAILFTETISRENSTDSFQIARESKDFYFDVSDVKFQDLYDWSLKEDQYTDEGIKKRRTGAVVTCNNKRLALFRLESEVYAIDEKCPHMGGPLHLGDIESIGEASLICVICPWHKWKLELSTGKLKAPRQRNIRNEVYPVKVLEDGSLKVGFADISDKYFNPSIDF